MKTRVKPAVKICLLIAIGIAGALISKSAALSQYINPESLQLWLMSFETFKPIVFIGLCIVGSIVAVPGSILSVVGGLTFGVVWGTIYTLIGTTIGAMITFKLTRVLGRTAILRLGWLYKGKIRQIDQHVKKNGFTTILFLRLVLPFYALNYGAGLSKISFRDFSLGTVVGIIPSIVIYALIGDALNNVFSFRFLLAILLLIIVIGVTMLHVRRQVKSH